MTNGSTTARLFDEPLAAAAGPDKLETFRHRQLRPLRPDLARGSSRTGWRRRSPSRRCKGFQSPARRSSAWRPRRLRGPTTATPPGSSSIAQRGRTQQAFYDLVGDLPTSKAASEPRPRTRAAQVFGARLGAERADTVPAGAPRPSTSPSSSRRRRSARPRRSSRSRSTASSSAPVSDMTTRQRTWRRPTDDDQPTNRRTRRCHAAQPGCWPMGLALPLLPLFLVFTRTVLQPRHELHRHAQHQRTYAAFRRTSRRQERLRQPHRDRTFRKVTLRHARLAPWHSR